MNMNEAKVFATDVYLTTKLAELPESDWTPGEKAALIQSGQFIKEWTNLRASILFHMLDNGEADTEEAQSRIAYWKDVKNGKNRSTPELPSTISKGNKQAAKEILESYRRELATDILKSAGELDAPAAKTAQDIKETSEKSTPVTTGDITVIEEDYIAEFVATNRGQKLDEFYHHHLVPAYKAVLADLQHRMENKPDHIPLERFRKENEIFLVHADFLREQIKLVRQKEPTVDNPIPVLTDIVELGNKQAAPKAPAIESPVPELAEQVQVPEEAPAKQPKPSFIKSLGSGLKSLFNAAVKKLTPSPRLGLDWGLATGAGLAAGVALATAMNVGDTLHPPKQIRSLAETEPKVTAAAETKAPLPSLEAPLTLDAQPVAKSELASKPAKSAPPKLVVLSTKTFMNQPKAGIVAPEPTRETTREAPQQLAEAKPIEQKSFDIETFRMDLSTLEKACRQVGKGTPDGICNDLQPQ